METRGTRVLRTARGLRNNRAGAAGRQHRLHRQIALVLGAGGLMISSLLSRTCPRRSSASPPDLPAHVRTCVQLYKSLDFLVSPIRVRLPRVCARVDLCLLNE